MYMSCFLWNSEYDGLVDLIEALNNHAVDSIVMDHFFFAHYRNKFNKETYLWRHGVTPPTTVGIMFNVDGLPGLTECVRKWAFTAHLKIADDVAESVEHSTEVDGRDSFEDSAPNLFGDANSLLIAMGCILLVLVALIYAIERVILRIGRRKDVQAAQCSQTGVHCECQSVEVSASSNKSEANNANGRSANREVNHLQIS